MNNSNQPRRVSLLIPLLIMAISACVCALVPTALVDQFSNLCTQVENTSNCLVFFNGHNLSAMIVFGVIGGAIALVPAVIIFFAMLPYRQRSRSFRSRRKATPLKHRY